jgi:RHS repeat-associated protein
MKRQKFLTGFLALVMVIVSLHPESSQAQTQESEPYVPSGILVTELGDEVPPGRLNVRFPHRDPVQVGEEIRTILQKPDSTSDRPVLAQTVPDITPEIQTLATGLENDPLAIYDYVYNHIDYIPSWGLLKNPRETLLASAGNAFDQAALLSALLEAAGFQTRYVWGNIRVTKAEAMNWVGATDPAVVGDVFASGGIPTMDEGSTLLMTHIWVQVSDGGTWHSLDPSFKSYSEQDGQDLHSLMNCDSSVIVTRAENGATIDPNFVQNLNQTNIRADLTTCASNLVDYLRGGDTFVYPEDLIGDRQIAPVESTSYPSFPPYTVVSTSGQAPDIPDSFAYELTIQLPGIDYTVNVDDIAGERITIFYECATPSDCQLLGDGGGVYNVEPAYQVNMVPRLRIGGTVVDTGDAVQLGSWGHRLDVTIATPISGWSPSFSQYLTAGEWYALPMRLQTVSNRALSRQIGLLNEAMSQGLDPEDEQVLGQMLHVLGLSYFNEVDLGDRIDSRLAQIVHIPHFSMMIASRNLVVWIDALQRPVALDPASHTVDVRLNVHSAVSAENPGNANRERAWFLSSGMRGSAVEHAIIEQLQLVPAISTVQILNRATEEGQRIFYLTSANLGTYLSELGDHSTTVVNSIIAYVSAGWHIVISEDPVTYGQWDGSGWITFDPNSGSAGYLIAGYLDVPPMQHTVQRTINGGSSAYQQTELGTEPGRRKNGQRFSDHLKTLFQPLNSILLFIRDLFISDPINAAIGTFVHHHQDLASLGGLGIPLGFERFYASSRHSLAGPLGFGWSHTYDARFFIGTDWARGFGSRTALEAAPALAAAQISLDFFDLATVPHQRFAMDVTLAQWLMTQITGNAATLIEPDGHVAAHVRLSDGAYQPPAGRGNLKTVSIGGDGSAILTWEDGTSIYFNKDGRPTTLDDANGNRTTLSYDGQDRLSQVSDAVGRTLTFTYDAQDRLTRITDPSNRTFDYGYDAHGNLQTYTDPRGGVTSYTYDTSHRLASIIDPLSATYVTNQYDALGRVNVQLDGRSGQTSLLYGGDHTIVTDPLGYRTTYFYDERTRLLGVKNALGNRTSIAYDAADHEVDRTNPLSQSTTFAYDAWGHLATITDALGSAITWVYDADGDPLSYTDQRGKTWQYTYDGKHNLAAVRDPLGGTTDYTYGTLGQLTRVQDPADVTFTYSYDAHGNLACLTRVLAEENCWEYDIVGRPISFTNGTGHTSVFSYDAADNLRQITDPLRHHISYEHDANNNLVRFIDANGNAITYTYDAQFNLTGVTDALGGVTTYDYDTNNGLIALTDANGHTTTYQRDLVGQVITITDPLNRSVAFSYDAAGRLTAFDRADGSRINYQRDALGRWTGVDYPTGPDITYSYDDAGNLTNAIYGGAWNASYGYDDAGRLRTVEDHTRNLTLAYQYNPAGRRTGLRVNRGVTTLYDLLYSYDGAGRLDTLTDQTDNPAATTTFAYDNASRMIRITDPGGARADYTHDDAGRLTAVRHRDDQGNTIATYSYTRDANGNPTVVVETTPVGTLTTSYTYDTLDRLTAEVYPRYTIGYAYDPVGNLIRRTDPLGMLNYSYDAADQLRSRGSESFNYDPHGNLTTWQSMRGTYAYAYDYENHLADLTLPDSTALAFAYDALGRRLTVQGPVDDRGLLHDGLNVLLEGDQDLSQVVARYLQGNGLLVGRYTDQLGFTFYHGDAAASVRYLMDTRGQPFDAYRYDAFGRPAQAAGIDPNPFRFVGQYGIHQHDVPGWPTLLMGFRYYDPGAGRFLTRDPLPGDLLRPHSLNDYNYALSNPARYNDPTGLRPLARVRGTTAQQTKSDLSSRAEVKGISHPSGSEDLQTASSPEPQPHSLRWTEPWSLFEFLRRYGLHFGFNIFSLKTSSDQWLSVAYHGSTYALACTADDQLLAGAFQSGLFRSTDAGHAFWNDVQAASVGEITIVDSNTVYAGTWSDGALKSNDGGASWTPINNGLIANDVYALAADPVASDHLFAGTEMGLFVSNNGGANWSRPTGTLPGSAVSELIFVGDILMVVTDLGLYRSGNDGASWSTPTVDLPPARINVLLAGSPGGTVYAGTALGLYKSTDHGDTWTPVGTGLTDKDVHALAIDPADANHMVAGTTDGLFVSTDGGDTWVADTHEGLDGIASLVGALAFCPGGGDANLYLGAGGGVYALRTPVGIEGVTITGPATGVVHTTYTFTATASPPSTTLPIEYAWQATEQETPLPKTGGRTTTIPFKWDEPGTQTITVTADNGIGTTSTTHTIIILPQAPTRVSLSGPGTGKTDTVYTFTVTTNPVTTTLPLTYTWEATDHTPETHPSINHLTDVMTFTWGIEGNKIVTATADNNAGTTSVAHTINITRLESHFEVYLPLILKSGPASAGGPTPGFWQSTTGDEFYVTADRTKVDDFAIHITVSGCGNYKITHPSPEPIAGNQFSFTGAFYASGTFNSQTTASGSDGLDRFNIPGCGLVSGGPWSWSATWQNSSQPTYLSAKVMGSEIVVPVTRPGRSTVTVVPIK